MTTFQKLIGYQFADEKLLEQAMTHKSYYNESGGKLAGHNEKLEFLGDAVLDLCLGHILFEKYPQLDEGQLSKVRASLVNEQFLMEFAKTLKLNETLLLGRGEENSGGREKPRLLASVFEAFIGSLYLDAGFEKSFQIVGQLFEQAVANIDLEHHFTTDYKTRLQERFQEIHKSTPVYKVVGEDGPDHEKTFCVELLLNNQKVAEGIGKSKKQAEQAAAKIALEKLS